MVRFIIAFCFHSLPTLLLSPYRILLSKIAGSRISLISKKNIRYEGTLYSINETDATVALKDVRAFGTEGRESENETFVPAQDAVHAYLLFRGCDIKDLHVHESSSNTNPQQEEGDTQEEETNGNQKESETTNATSAVDETSTELESNNAGGDDDDEGNEESNTSKQKKEGGSESKSNEGKSSNNSRRKKNNNPKKMVGSGASLLRLKARGVVDGDNGK